MAQKQYWKGLEELENTPEHQQIVANEFQEELPVVGDLSGKLMNAETPRRDFLKFLGFSTLAATVAASCEMPVRKAIPYAIKPEDITPGVPNYYASSYIDNGEYCAVVVKTREGRPIMVEGNSSSKITNGATSARVIASTLSLYDKARLRQPLANGNAVDTFEAVDTPIKQGLANANGSIYLVTGTILSPTTKSVIDLFTAKYPNAKHIQYDPISYNGLALANDASFGKKAIPSYHMEKAQTIFSLGADFLGTWLAPNEFSHGYNVNRKITAKNPTMSKHYQVEAMMSMTGSNADERATCRPSEYGKVAAALYEAIVNGTSPKVGSDKLNTLIAKAAKDLKNNGLVLCGSNDVNVQIIVNAINSAIGAYGNTISWGHTSNYKQGDDKAFVEFVNAMNAGQVGAVLIHGVNPSYDYFEADKFNTGLSKVALSVSFGERLDETAEKCKYVVPDHHWLESWGDAEPKSGYYSFLQPTIAPLFKSRAFQDSLLVWADNSSDYYTIFNNYWVNKLGQSTFDKALQDGVYQPETATLVGASFSGNVSAAIDAVRAYKSNSEGQYEVVIYESVAIGHGGSASNNPWLQEMPDPVTRATWDNYVCMSYKTAKEKFGYELTLHNQVVHDKKVVKVAVNGKEVALPLVVLPGMHNDVIAIAVGYGRSEGVGRAAANLGANVYGFGAFTGQNFVSYNFCTIENTNDMYPVAITQTHHSYEGREIIQEFTLEEFKKDPKFLLNKRKKDLGHYTTLHWEGHHDEHGTEALTPGQEALKHDKDFEKNGTLYPVHEKHGIKWGMSIDLNTCTGCGACVVACQAENNVSVVGKKQVMMAHDMSWIRIDRYFSGNPDDPDTIQTVYQPMICQHCDNAPCENVCPVSATNHSDEGLNQMAYNRCIGTKYCANNCPYKVRRFNWFDWNGADSFEDNLYFDGRTDDMNDDLTRMVLNPDVTVRSRGVMEKCSFCVQRLQAGKLQAKMEGRPLKDSDVSTACQTACAGDCITFGNVNDTESKIYKERYEENSERLFYVLEYLHILPNVNYLSKIRNTDSVVAKNKEEDIFQLKNI
jgi:MoCo/4Fe-4S cofactor protein with predicted Tat translocation signal